MVDAPKTDVIKNAAQFLRMSLADRGVVLGSSHAHAAVAHWFGYNSKKALLDDNNFDLEDQNLFLHRTHHLCKLKARTVDMKGMPLQKVDMSEVAEIIFAGLAPECEISGKKELDIRPVGYDSDNPDGWVSSRLAINNPDYDLCVICGPATIFRATDINHNGECPEHRGETFLSEEDQENWDSYLENVGQNLE